MNKRAQESIQQLPAIDHPSHKKLIMMIVVAIVIIALAVTAFVVFKNKITKVETPFEPATDTQTKQVLTDLSNDMTPEEQAAAESTLQSLAAETAQ